MVLGIFAVTLFVSAFLLFLVQPMIGKLILPKLGGTPQVWNTCMVFFQSTLLAGYAYTHTTSTRFPVKKQLLIHCLLLFIPLLILLPPIGPFDIVNWMPPQGANPIWSTLLLLAFIVGLPFFIVSTSAPLLQKWFAHTDDPAAQDPYFLYAASNLGSMLGLLAYPLLIEWLLPLESQKWLWLVGYGILMVTVGACAFIVWKSPNVDRLVPEPEVPPAETPAPPEEVEPSTAVTAKPPASVSKASKRKKKRKGKAQHVIEITKHHAPVVDEPPPPDDNITPWRRLRWTLLAAAPSSLMLGLTTYISTDLSPFPLIWVIPLALYLLSFILVFMKSPIRWTGTAHTLVLWTQPIAIFAFVWVLMNTSFDPFFATAIIWLAFFSTALACHGEMAKDRPSAKHLTEFYLWMSFGGMLGGVFNGLIAPLLFTDIVEFPLAIVLACFLRPILKKEGWIDTYINTSFPHSHHWARTTGAKFAETTQQSFWVIWGVAVLVYFAVVYFLMIEGGFATGIWVIALFVGAFFAMATLALRYWPARLNSLCLDIALPLVPVLLAIFLRYNADNSWLWNPRFRLEFNKLTSLLSSLGFVDAYQNPQGAARLTQLVYGLLVFGVPMIFAMMFSSRPIRFGITVAGILLLNRYVFDRQPDVVYAGRSYFGVLRVFEDDQTIRQSLEPRVPDGDTAPELLKPDLYLRDESALPLNSDKIPTVPVTRMRHGTTLHGLNFQHPQLSRLATTYYHRKGPVGAVMEKLNWFKGPQNSYWADNRLPASVVGAGAAGFGTVPLPITPLVAAWSEPPYATIGLGTGTMASYGRPFQHVTFYEIDDNVRNFSLPPGSTANLHDYDNVVKRQKAFYETPIRERKTYFTYVKEAIERGARLEIIMGDARLSLQEESPRVNRYGFSEEEGMPGLYPKRDHYYRAMEIDAFSSDAIPVHLITKEAIELYFSKLAPDGVICVHTSNRHIELEQAVFNIAKAVGCAYVYASDHGPFASYEQRKRMVEKGLFFRGGEKYLGYSGSTYVMLARDLKYLVNKGDVAEDLAAGESGTMYNLPVPEVYVPAFSQESQRLSGFELLSRFRWYGRNFVLMGRDGPIINARPNDSAPWTDDFSNIVQLLR